MFNGDVFHSCGADNLHSFSMVQAGCIKFLPSYIPDPRNGGMGKISYKEVKAKERVGERGERQKRETWTGWEKEGGVRQKQEAWKGRK